MDFTTIESIKELLAELETTGQAFSLTIPIGESGEDYGED